MGMHSLKVPKDKKQEVIQILNKKENLNKIKKLVDGNDFEIVETPRRVQIKINGGSYSVNTLSQFLSKILPSYVQIPFWG